MKYLFRAAVAIVASFGLGASAIAAPCTPIPAKDVQGHIEFAPPGGESLALSYFQQNGCDWAGMDQLNGSDGLVLDVEGMGGTNGNMVAEMGIGLVLVGIQGQFLDENCSPIAGSEVAQASDSETYTLEIPVGAKWFAVGTNTVIPSRDVFITLHSDGKICKKKKKRK